MSGIVLERRRIAVMNVRHVCSHTVAGTGAGGGNWLTVTIDTAV